MDAVFSAETTQEAAKPQGSRQLTYMWPSSVPKLWKLVSDSPPKRVNGRFGHRDTLEFLCETQKYIAKICKPIDLPPFYHLRKGNSGKSTPATSRPGTRGRANERKFIRKSDSLQRFQGLTLSSSRQSFQHARTVSIPVLNLSFKGKKDPETIEAPARSPFIQRYRGGGGFKAAPEYVIRHQQEARKGCQTARDAHQWLSGLDH